MDRDKRKKRKKKNQKDEDLMNLTPMIDVVFLLLIFFLCLEFKTLEGKLATNLPKDLGVNTTQAMPIEKIDLRIACTNWGDQAPDEYDPRRFELTNHRVVWYLGPKRVTGKLELEKALRKAVKVKVQDAKGRTKPRPITIKTGPSVTYGDVTQVVDFALDAGFEEITFGGGEGTRKNPKAK